MQRLQDTLKRKQQELHQLKLLQHHQQQQQQQGSSSAGASPFPGGEGTSNLDILGGINTGTGQGGADQLNPTSAGNNGLGDLQGLEKEVARLEAGIQQMDRLAPPHTPPTRTKSNPVSLHFV